MKETIEYYYSLKIDDIYLEGDTYHFLYDNCDYYFVYCRRPNKELNDIVECSKEIKNKNIVCHDIILNIQNNIITKVEGLDYLLLRVSNKNKEYSIVDIIEQNKKTKLSKVKSDLYRNDWSNLWSSKIDYIESQMNEINVDRIIRKSIDYYIGLAENAIAYVNLINERYVVSEQDNIVLSHKRIYYPNIGLNYSNPLTYIFDLEVRDVAEYIKSSFFAGEDAFLDLQTYLRSVILTPYSYNMLFARLLYPSYYFDNYERVINFKENEEAMIKIISKVDDYEKFLKKAYKEISLYTFIEPINWLIY